MRLFLLLLASLNLFAADFTGIWTGQSDGGKEDIAFQFQQSGAVLTGKLYGDYQSTPIVKGIVSGDIVTFLVLRQEQSGNEINETRIRFSGKLTNGALELTREREGSTRAGSGAAVTYKNNPRVVFQLKRLGN